jgi:hypothetical protein
VWIQVDRLWRGAKRAGGEVEEGRRKVGRSVQYIVYIVYSV